MTGLCDELGDLLFQVVFHAQMAKEAGVFEFSDVAGAISDKMVRRHPHVFGDVTVKDADAQTVAWEDLKAGERARAVEQDPSALAGVAVGLPALTRAKKLQNRAARVGFDWDEARQVLEKVREEIGEIEEEMANNGSSDRLEDEIGDLLFSGVNLARKLGIDPEAALRRGNQKFERRFRHMEAEIDRTGGVSLADASLDEMTVLWEASKTKLSEG
jgi:MazG family protein